MQKCTARKPTTHMWIHTFVRLCVSVGSFKHQINQVWTQNSYRIITHNAGDDAATLEHVSHIIRSPVKCCFQPTKSSTNFKINISVTLITLIRVTLIENSACIQVIRYESIENSLTHPDCSLCWKHKLTVAYFKMISARSSAIRVSMSFFMSISAERGKQHEQENNNNNNHNNSTWLRERTQLIDVGDCCWPPNRRDELAVPWNNLLVMTSSYKTSTVCNCWLYNLSFNLKWKINVLVFLSAES